MRLPSSFQLGDEVAVREERGAVISITFRQGEGRIEVVYTVQLPGWQLTTYAEDIKCKTKTT